MIHHRRPIYRLAPIPWILQSASIETTRIAQSPISTRQTLLSRISSSITRQPGSGTHIKDPYRQRRR